MIDWKLSAEHNGTTEGELRVRFIRYPQSNKKVVAVCDVCEKVRMVTYQRYVKLCHKCSQGTPEARKANSLRCIERFSDPVERELARLRAIKQFSDLAMREAARLKTIEQFSTQESRDEMSNIKKQYYIDNPEAAEAARLRGIERFATQESRDEMSNTMKNSPAHKEVVEKMVGGNDIVGHHLIYDHSDLSENVINVTRSMHMRIHRMLQKHGIEVSHINVAITEPLHNQRRV